MHDKAPTSYLKSGSYLFQTNRNDWQLFPYSEYKDPIRFARVSGSFKAVYDDRGLLLWSKKGEEENSLAGKGVSDVATATASAVGVTTHSDMRAYVEHAVKYALRMTGYPEAGYEPGELVKVPALDWVEDSEGGQQVFTANSLAGTYTVFRSELKTPAVDILIVRWYGPGGISKDAEDEHAAKAEALEHFRGVMARGHV